MLPGLRFTLLISLATLVGCGVSSTPPTTSSPYLNLTGNWQFQIQVVQGVPGGGFSTPVEDFSGSLSSSAGSVTGILHARPLALPNCVAETADLPVNGSLDTAGNLTITFPIAGGVGTISFNATPPLRSPFLSGTYQAIGGTCAQASGSLTAFEVMNVTGTYIGTATQIYPIPSGSAPTSNVTAILIQSDVPNGDGQYPLSGTITSTGACNSTLTFNQGLVYGDTIQSYPGPMFPMPTGSFTGFALPSSNHAVFSGNLYQFTGCGTTSFNVGLFAPQ